jgi:hypothetical protein
LKKWIGLLPHIREIDPWVLLVAVGLAKAASLRIPQSAIGWTMIWSPRLGVPRKMPNKMVITDFIDDRLLCC